MTLRSNTRNGTGTRWQKCRSSLVSSLKVSNVSSVSSLKLLHPPHPHHPFPSFLPTFLRLLPTVVNALVQPPSLVASGITFATPLHTFAYRNTSAPFVASKRTFSSLVSKVKAKVQEFEQTRYAKIFTLFFSSTCHMALHPRHASADQEAHNISVTFTHSSHLLTSVPTSYRNSPNPSSSGTGAGTGTGYDAQPPSPVLDRHAQQAYYAPRPAQSTPQQLQNIPPSGDNRAVRSSVPPSSVDEDSAGVPPPPATNSGRPVSNNIDPGSAVSHLNLR